MTIFQQFLKYALIAMGTALAIFVAISYFRVTAEVVGEVCPVIDDAPEETEFDYRRRSDQRLNMDFDLRGTLGGPELSCLSVLGQAKCETAGPAILAGQLGYRGDVKLFSIPEGRTAVVQLNAIKMLCLMPEL